MHPSGKQRRPDDRPLDLRGLFETHYAAIWRLLERLGVPRRDLDDAAQEVFWVAARRLDAIRAGSEHAFLYGVALRIAADFRRKLSSERPKVAFDFADDFAAQSHDPEQALQAHQARKLLDTLLDQLPDDLRCVFVLFELEGLEVTDIAALHGIPVGTASSRLRRARQEFSAQCKRLQAVRERTRR